MVADRARRRSRPENAAAADLQALNARPGTEGRLTPLGTWTGECRSYTPQESPDKDVLTRFHRRSGNGHAGLPGGPRSGRAAPNTKRPSQYTRTTWCLSRVHAGGLEAGHSVAEASRL